MDKRGFNKVEAAAYLGITVYVLNEETRQSRIAAKKRGTTVLYDRSELDRYFDALPERA